MKLWIAQLILLAGSFARAESCETARLAVVLEQLKEIGQLHNCELEVLSRDSDDGLRKYLVLANDLIATEGAPRSPVSYEFSISRACLDSVDASSISGRLFRDSYGYHTPQKDYRIALMIQMGNGHYPSDLQIQNINLTDGRTEARVDCQFDPEGL